MDITALREKYTAGGQGQVFDHFDSLSPAEQTAFVAQLDTIDPQRVNALFKQAMEASKAPLTGTIAPPPETSVGDLSRPEEVAAWEAKALAAYKAGTVAVILMAGGQGTRLGSSAPKGCYDIGLPSHKSLFQMQAERVRRLEALSGGVIPWYIMTSGPTRSATEAHFVENNYFGLSKANVVFFEQGVLPCLDDKGRILLDGPGRVATAPDGNGGIYRALDAIFPDLEARGIQHAHVYCVDNCLVKVCDPVFVGYCLERAADVGVKVVTKTDPSESVGVVALRGKEFAVVEYSEIPSELAAERAPSGALAYRAANIANHFYTLDFLRRTRDMEARMAYHLASKKIPYIDASGTLVKPTAPNGYKMELFVFDVFAFAEKLQILEVPREDEFAPLKNAPGSATDSPETSRAALLAQHRRWLVSAGAKVPEGVEIELSPLLTYAGEGLEGVNGKTLGKSGVAESITELLALV